MIKKYDYTKLQPYKFFKFFEEISQIPRSPSNETLIADYLVNFAKKRNLEFYRDKIDNVIIYKEASKGFEDRDILGLQNHVDMVCEKEKEIKHDFFYDPLQLYIEGDFVKAKGTTLGADNGVGVAYVLAILDSKEIKTPELECIFTVQEETTMDGSRFLDVSKIKTKRIISFDSFYEDIMVVNSASCKEWEVSFENEYTCNIKDMLQYKLEFSGFKGGHSGLDIGDEERANPIKLAFNLLGKFDGVILNQISGGSGVSVIPRNISLSFCITNQANIIEKLNCEVEKLNYKYNEEQISLELEELKSSNKLLSLENSKKIINFINCFENGPLNFDEENQIIVSGNFGEIQKDDNVTTFKFSVRSNDINLGNERYNKINKTISCNGMSIVNYSEMKPYNPKKYGGLVNICSEIYKELFNKEIVKIKSQSCLEIGFLAEKINGLEYIAIAPNIYNAHSPDEKFSISSAKKIWKYILQILDKI